MINKGNQISVVILCVILVFEYNQYIISQSTLRTFPSLSGKYPATPFSSLLPLLLYGLFQHWAPGTAEYVLPENSVLKWNIHGHLRF